MSNPTTDLPFEQMCHEARQSCRVSGLMPKEWRWGRDVVMAVKRQAHMQLTQQFVSPPTAPAGALIIYEGLPVFRMAASGVACIGQRTELGIFQHPKF